MTNPVDTFEFDVNYSFGETGIFSSFFIESGVVPPPSGNLFLLENLVGALYLEEGGYLLLQG